MGKDWDPYMVARDRSGRRIDRRGRDRERIRTGSAAFNGRELRMMIGIGLALAIILFEGTRSGFGFGMLASDEPNDRMSSPRPAAEAETEGRLLRPESALGGGAPGAAATSLLRGVTVRPDTVRPIDGGSFALHGERIRLADIDTPDLRAPCPHEAALGAQATRRLASLLRAGPFQLSESFGRDADSEGRKLRIASRGGHSLGDAMVADGLARPWSTVPAPWCATGFGEL
jgi:micrococcal nuclease